MYTKEELKALKIQFWEEFKVFMSKHKSVSGKRINWLNYKTKIDSIYFRLETDKNTVRVCFDIQHKDSEIRAIIWEQMVELKKVLTDEMGIGKWNNQAFNSTIPEFCRISWELENVRYLNSSDKEKIFLFFEDKLISFDRFYDTYQDILIHLIN
jgi:Domain of unknown function (DUF4268)